MKEKLDSKSAQVLEEKNKCCEQMAKEVEQRHMTGQTVDDLYNWINKLHSEINDQKKATKPTKNKVKRHKE